MSEENTQVVDDSRDESMVLFELSETDEEMISGILSKVVAEGLEIDWDKVENINLEIFAEYAELFPDLDELNLLVIGVNISENMTVYLNAIQYEWPQRLKGMVSMSHSFPIGKVEGVKSISILNARKKIESLLLDEVLTFYREEV